VLANVAAPELATFAIADCCQIELDATGRVMDCQLRGPNPWIVCRRGAPA
jgi:hypothetical protein